MATTSDPTKATRGVEAVAFPAVVLIDNCNACNLTCSMCDHKHMAHYRRVQTMDRDLYEKIVDEIAVENPDARVWEIFFGEPCLCKDMPDRVRYAKERGLGDVVLNSNGVLLTADRARALIEAGLDALYVGIDAFQPETYARIRVGGDYDRTVQNVLGYRDLLAVCGHADQELFVQFVVSDINAHEVDDFKAFWQAQGVRVKVRPKVSWAGLVDAPNLHDNRQVQRRPCYWLMRAMNICADGEVALCSVDVHCRVRCGNVREHSLRDLWHGRLGRLRQLQKDGRFGELPDVCRDCRDWQSAYADYA